MDKILRIFGMFLAIIFLVAINIGLSYILPFPYSKLNILFAVIIILMLLSDSGLIVWITFFSHLFIELFSTTPFGVIIFSSTISILVAFWLYKHIFTNRSLLATIALSSFALIFYRLIYILLLAITRLFGIRTEIPWQLIFITFLWEFLFTTTLVAIFYFILSKFSKRLKTNTVDTIFFKI